MKFTIVEAKRDFDSVHDLDSSRMTESVDNSQIADNKVYVFDRGYLSSDDIEEIHEYLVNNDILPSEIYYDDIEVATGTEPDVYWLSNGDPGYPGDDIVSEVEWYYKPFEDSLEIAWIEYLSSLYGDSFTGKDLKSLDRKKFEKYLQDYFRLDAERDANENFNA